MPFTVTIDRQPGYVRFNVAGPASLKNYFDLIDEAARVAMASGTARGLADLRGVEGRLPFTDQFFIGDVVAAKLARFERLALLVAHDPTSYNSETVARRRGVALRTFAEEGLAVAWLLAGDDG